MASPPFKVKALYDYSSPHDDDLKFPSGQIITVTEVEDADWYYGNYANATGQKFEGIFPMNFVERYEPEAPPRPTRSARPKKEPSTIPVVPHIPEPEADEEEQVGTPENEEKMPMPAPPPLQVQQKPIEVEKVVSQSREAAEIKPSPAPKLPTPQPVTAPLSKVMPQTQPLNPPKPGPPPVAEKPAIGSFKDRIAAFNKAAAPPIAPFKPGALSGGTSFIKKPFVAPPPSKNSYVPPPREPPPPKVYRREEDPEIVAQASQDLENAEKVGLLGSNSESTEEQPKPTSLKERIALLQKQQLEQANRHAEAAQKKGPPKRPSKQRVDSMEEPDIPEPLENAEPGQERDYSQTAMSEAPARSFSKRKPVKEVNPAEVTPSFPGELHSDANDADQSGGGETTEDQGEVSSAGHGGTDNKPKLRSRPSQSLAPLHVAREVSSGNASTGGPGPADKEGQRDEGDAEQVDGAGEEDEGGEEEDIDPEVKRRMEIRARMAKMSGGMGMYNMFGPQGGIPSPPPAASSQKKKMSGSSMKHETEDPPEESSAPPRALPQPPPIPALPPTYAHQDPTSFHPHRDDADGDPEDELPADNSPTEERIDRRNTDPIPPSNSSGSPHRGAPPPIPMARSHESSAPKTPEAYSQLEGEQPSRYKQSDVPTTTYQDPQPHKPHLSLTNTPAQARPGSSDSHDSQQPSMAPSYFGLGPFPVTSPTSPTSSNKRLSRMPPIPSSNPLVSPHIQGRPPPPPPPTGPSISRRSTSNSRTPIYSKHVAQDESDEVTEYEGDYDTDIAPGATHKDALKAHTRESSNDDNNTFVDSSSFQPHAIPTIPRGQAGPQTSAPRSVPPPPPPPSQPPKAPRHLEDMPRVVPPPMPHTKQSLSPGGDEEYDPYGYMSQSSQVAPVGSTVRGPEPLQAFVTEQEEHEDINSPVHNRSNRQPFRPQDQGSPMSPQSQPAQLSLASRAPPRQSLDVQRSQSTARRSMEQNRPSGEHDFISSEVDLGEASLWWADSKKLPPAFQGRKDIHFEIERSDSTARNGALVEVYILFHDYSQTIISVRFDPNNPKDSMLEQRHEAPPAKLRQDQLEDAHASFGQLIAEAAPTKLNTTVGDGAPQSLILDLLNPLPNALPPVGMRSYGALVYANLANASLQQFDEIRPGDIMTFRNAKFQGHTGAMHKKYSSEIGRPDHVAVVVDWDGTKKKVRAYEQGRESKKVKIESFKVGDLRSGEVKIWRVMSKAWVGWQGMK
ncbi:MAG: hypothetical protein M1829_001138 [Trizodia sp. TS-e1964]|nr:MAG: hypothetical protein M1829_001138 [Trizodia sp. TS-e1964]